MTPKITFRTTSRRVRGKYRKILVAALPLILLFLHGSSGGTWLARQARQSGGGGDGAQSVEEQGEVTALNRTTAKVEEGGKLFPPDLFDLQQRKNGAVVFCK
jgi:hypothetical protein